MKSAIGVSIDRNGCSSFSKKYGIIMPLLHKPHQTVTWNMCVGFCKTTYGISERQFCWLTYPLKWNWDSSEKMNFFTVKSSNNYQRCYSANQIITFSELNIQNRMTELNLRVKFKPIDGSLNITQNLLSRSITKFLCVWVLS